MGHYVSVISGSYIDNDVYGSLTWIHRGSLHEKLYILMSSNVACNKVDFIVGG